jgi:tRNA (5-methylaminomethyl-2-thiouridylate)-methyltransferase
MKIAIGLSGGVDSSVAALLLKEAGHDVIALFMQNWHNTTGTLYGDCPWEEDRAVAELVAKRLGIPFYFVDLSDTYTQRVVDYMFEEYRRGRTPNPDVMCNREIKFEAFLKHALELGAEMVATGHYCRKEVIIGMDGRETYRILAGVDPGKDQSYFLCQLSQEQLSKALFPIGGFMKAEVRELAAKGGLPTANKKDSQGICFVGKVDLPVFLQQKLAASEGEVVEVFEEFYEDHPLTRYAIKGYPEQLLRVENDFLNKSSQPYIYSRESGKIVGKHRGAHFYTIGQRKGLNIGGHIEPLFIISLDIENNIIYVGEGERHRGLYRKALFINGADIHWIRRDLKMESGETREYLVRIRYRQPLQKARLFMRDEGLYIVFEEPQRGITPGQFAAWYDGEEMLGSGDIQ